MTTDKHDSSLGTGVFFAKDDYAGIIRRIFILVIDLIAILVGYVVLAVPYAIFFEVIDGPFVLLYFGFVWAYSTVLKASPIRTVGFRLTGTRILNLRGERPSILQMTFRLLLWVMGPINLVYDLFWAGTDEDRQTLRDRFAGTCVVKNNAEPIGTGDIHLCYYTAMAMSLMYPAVIRPAKPDSKEVD